MVFRIAPNGDCSCCDLDSCVIKSFTFMSRDTLSSDFNATLTTGQYNAVDREVTFSFEETNSSSIYVRADHYDSDGTTRINENIGTFVSWDPTSGNTTDGGATPGWMRKSINNFGDDVDVDVVFSLTTGEIDAFEEGHSLRVLVSTQSGDFDGGSSYTSVDFQPECVYNCVGGIHPSIIGDNFNRADGALGSPWVNVVNAEVSSNELLMTWNSSGFVSRASLSGSKGEDDTKCVTSIELASTGGSPSYEWNMLHKSPNSTTPGHEIWLFGHDNANIGAGNPPRWNIRVNDSTLITGAYTEAIGDVFSVEHAIKAASTTDITWDLDFKINGTSVFATGDITISTGEYNPCETYTEITFSGLPSKELFLDNFTGVWS